MAKFLPQIQRCQLAATSHNFTPSVEVGGVRNVKVGNPKISIKFWSVLESLQATAQLARVLRKHCPSLLL